MLLFALIEQKCIEGMKKVMSFYFNCGAETNRRNNDSWQLWQEITVFDRFGVENTILGWSKQKIVPLGESTEENITLGNTMGVFF